MRKIGKLSRKFERNGLSFSAVDQISLTIRQRDFVQIIGRSGSGKTTFLNLIMGLLKSGAGSIVLPDNKLTQLDDRNAWIGYLPQGNSLTDNFFVLDNVWLPYYFLISSHDDITGRADYVLNEVGIGYLRDVYPAQLSDGEQDVPPLREY